MFIDINSSALASNPSENDIIYNCVIKLVNKIGMAKKGYYDIFNF